MSSIGYFFKESLQGFVRNLSTTLGSIITIFLSLLVIGIFMVAGVTLENLMRGVEDEVTITAYLSDDASQEDIDSVIGDIERMQDVSNVTFTSKDQALENFKESMTSNPEIIEQLDGVNPLPASIDVELSDPQMVSTVAKAIENNSTYQTICEDPDNVADSILYGQDTVEKLFKLTNYIRYIVIALIVLLIFIALVFINNTIRLAILARRKEIAIMRLVGASNGFIRGPFLMEGALHSLIGALAAIGVLQLLRVFAIPRLQEAIRFFDFTVDPTVYMIIYVSLVVVGIVIGMLGSAIAMRRYLKV